jgi:DNA-binding MarR family transcriptional regulator
VGRIWDDAYAQLGLAPAHAYLLRLVLAEPGLIQAEIGAELHLQKSTITRFIDKMVKQGYLLRKTETINDIKYKKIFATEKAKKIENELKKIGDGLYENILNVIGSDKAMKLVKEIKNSAIKL